MKIGPAWWTVLALAALAACQTEIGHGNAQPAIVERGAVAVALIAQPDADRAEPRSVPTWDPTGLPGVCYSPYNSDGTCKTAGQVGEDVARFARQYSVVRLYGTDCNQVALVYGPATAARLRLFVGLFSLDGQEQELETVVAALRGHSWAAVAAVAVGNELVNSGQASPQRVVAAVVAARRRLRAAGYGGPVVTVDTFVAVRQTPALCDVSDFCAVNVHPFFDGGVAAPGAGGFVRDAVDAVRAVLFNRNQSVVVTETGWPWNGTRNGAAIPGLVQQAEALASVRAAFASSLADVFLFSAYNDRWKRAEPATFDAEQYWGIGGADAPSAAGRPKTS